MQKIAIIGAGISGLSVAHLLRDRYEVYIFERDNCAGGLIKCRRVDGSLFHTCGGHVLNFGRRDVFDWFWKKFACEEEFLKADRNSCVFMDKTDAPLDYDIIPYPIENHVYLFDGRIQKAFYEDLEEIDKVKGVNATFAGYESFGDLLRWRFGRTLYDIYFHPYNEKAWRRDLTTMPLPWMEGKLPMPTTLEMRDNNANKVEEKSFVHSTFWYGKRNGSQYIADKLAEDLNIVYNTDITIIEKYGDKWMVCGQEFDKVVFCGNVKDMVKAVRGVDVSRFAADIEALEYNGTTSVFCEIDRNPYSWIYQPSRQHRSHRIICTGNFAESNNAELPEDRITATVEFTDVIGKEDILEQLKRIPLNPKYLDHMYNQYSYPIQDKNTRAIIGNLKDLLASEGFFFTGRFADWEYYNMDAAIGAAIDLCKSL